MTTDMICLLTHVPLMEMTYEICLDSCLPLKKIVSSFILFSKNAGDVSRILPSVSLKRSLGWNYLSKQIYKLCCQNINYTHVPFSINELDTYPNFLQQ